MRTRRLTLRPLAPRDAATLAQLAGDWDVARMTSRIPFPYGVAQARAWLAMLDGQSAFGIVYRWRLIGVCGFRAESETEAEIGYWLGRPWWGRGFATEAGSRLVEHCFGLGFTTLTCSHFIDNPASARVIAKLGFEPAGPANTWCEARGQYVTALSYRLQAPDISQRRTLP